MFSIRNDIIMLVFTHSFFLVLMCTKDILITYWVIVFDDPLHSEISKNDVPHMHPTMVAWVHYTQATVDILLNFTTQFFIVEVA